MAVHFEFWKENAVGTQIKISPSMVTYLMHALVLLLDLKSLFVFFALRIDLLQERGEFQN